MAKRLAGIAQQLDGFEQVDQPKCSFPVALNKAQILRLDAGKNAIEAGRLQAVRLLTLAVLGLARDFDENLAAERMRDASSLI